MSRELPTRNFWYSSDTCCSDNLCLISKSVSAGGWVTFFEFTWTTSESFMKYVSELRARANAGFKMRLRMLGGLTLQQNIAILPEQNPLILWNMESITHIISIWILQRFFSSLADIWYPYHSVRTFTFLIICSCMVSIFNIRINNPQDRGSLPCI